MNDHRTHRTLATAALACLALTAGCTSTPQDRAGGKVQAVSVVLDMAVGNDGAPAQLAAWADQVKATSKGGVVISFSTEYAHGTTDYEVRAFRDVASAKIATASLGARALDRVGVTSFQGLLAPMLVDSYELEAQVFASGVSDEMLQAVHSPGVVALAILPGPMRKILGLNKPFLEPADFVGKRIGDQDSALTELTLHTLGATAVPEPTGAKLVGVDGYEQQLSSIEGNGYADTGAKYTTANLNLWPRPIVVVIGSAAYARLSASQRDALHGAAKATLANAMDLSQAEDTTTPDKVCGKGMQLPAATPAQLAAMNDALKPTYDSLATTPSTKAWIDRIQHLKVALHAAPATVACPSDATTASSPIEGTYEEHVPVAQDLRRSCPAKDLPASLPPDSQIDTITVSFAHGSVTQFQATATGGREVGWHGTYQIFKDTLQLTSGSDVLTMTWRITGSTLRLSDLRNSHDCHDTYIWATHPWTKISH